MISVLPERIEAKIAPEPLTGCWLWTATLTHDGYGQSSLAGRHVYAHRLVYELLVGPIPDGLDLDHLCRVRCCVNPDHLEPVTNRENLARGIGAQVTRERHASRTHCSHGHLLSDDNVYVDPRGWRQCRTCNRRTWAKYRRNRRAA